MAKPILGYWELRGRAEPIRYLLHYKKIDFEDKRYSANAVGKEEWQKEKFSLGLDFPNLPYYIEGDIKLTQSIAIIRYLGLKHGLIGQTDEQQRRALVVEQQIADFREKFISFAKGDDYEKIGKENFLESIHPILEQWEKFLVDKKFTVGDDITYVDFMVYEVFDLYRIFEETILDDYPTLKAYFNRMKNLLELQEYFNSSIRKKWPILGSKARFGGSGDPPKHL